MELVDTMILAGTLLLGLIFFWWVIRKANKEVGKKK